MFLKNFDPVVSDEVFSVGTAHDVITPPIGFKIFSPEKPPKISLSINDDLLVRVINMKNKIESFLFIGLDVWGISEEFERKLKYKINKKTSDQFGKNIIVSVTGNGCSPNLYENTDEYLIYSEYLIEQIIGCINHSMFSMKPASMGSTVTKINDLTTFVDGPGMPGNPALILCVINDSHGKNIAKIINFSCPGIIFQSNPFWSSDYPGYVAWALENSNEGKTIFIQGSSADIRPYDWFEGNHKISHFDRNYSDVIAFGLFLSTKIAEVAENTIQRRNVKLRTELDDETGIQVSQIGDMFLVSNPRKQSNRFSRHIMRDLPNSTIMITTGTRGESFDVKYRFDAKGRRRAINILKNFGAK